MLNLDQIAINLQELAASRQSLGDFEAWFREHSRDVHLWGDSILIEVVFSIEDVLTMYHFEGLGEQDTKQALLAAIRPFYSPEAGARNSGQPVSETQRRA